MNNLKEKSNITQPERLCNPSPQRDVSADILRILATLFIFLTHFFLRTEFYSLRVENYVIASSMSIRNLGLLSIHLFMLLTGYIQAEKKIAPDLKYFSKLVKFTIPHILVILSAFLVNIIFHHESYSVFTVVKNLFLYPGYSWYVELYIGLFLMIPFLNIIWQNLSSKKQELALIGVLVFLSILPTIINVYNVGSSSWYKASSQPYNKIIPEFWLVLYPLAHYFVGAYLKKYGKELRKGPLKAFLRFALCFIPSSAYCIFRAIGSKPSVYSWIDKASLLNLICASALLLFITSIDFSKLPKALKDFARKLSELSFLAYLASYIVDINLYPYVNKYLSRFTDKLLLLPLIVLSVAVLSFTLAFLLSLISKPLEKGTQKLILKTFRKKG